MAKENPVDPRYDGIRPQTLYSLQLNLGRDFTQKQVRDLGRVGLLRLSGLGKVGAREAMEWSCRDLSAIPDVRRDIQLEALILDAKACPDPAEALEAIMRQAWSGMSQRERNRFEEVAKWALSDMADKEPAAPRM